MAKQRGEYLQKNLAFGKLSASIARGVIIFAGLVGVVVIAFLYSLLGVTGVFYALVLLLLLGEGWLFAQVWPALKASKRFAGQFSKGISGENAIWRALYSLPEGYMAFANVVLKDGAGDIDFAVTSERGVYAIDAKNYANVTLQNGELYQNGKPMYRNLIGQVTGEAFELSQFLNAKTGVKTYVTGVLVFVGNETITRPVQIRSIWIVPESQLIQFILNGRGLIKSSDLTIINNILRLMAS